MYKTSQVDKVSLNQRKNSGTKNNDCDLLLGRFQRDRFAQGKTSSGHKVE